MRYETPELTALTPAINAIHSSMNKSAPFEFGDGVDNETTLAYADWE